MTDEVYIKQIECEDIGFSATLEFLKGEYDVVEVAELMIVIQRAVRSWWKLREIKEANPEIYYTIN